MKNYILSMLNPPQKTNLQLVEDVLKGAVKAVEAADREIFDATLRLEAAQASKEFYLKRIERLS